MGTLVPQEASKPPSGSKASPSVRSAMALKAAEDELLELKEQHARAMQVLLLSPLSKYYASRGLN